jgi:hypothetical protein
MKILILDLSVNAMRCCSGVTHTQMDFASADMDKLKQSTGIDFIALREKYKNIPREIDPTPKLASDPQTFVSLADEHALASKKLDEYRVCKTCLGLGIVTEIYNHFKIDKNCPECDGDCIFQNVAG